MEKNEALVDFLVGKSVKWFQDNLLDEMKEANILIQVSEFVKGPKEKRDWVKGWFDGLGEGDELYAKIGELYYELRDKEKGMKEGSLETNMYNYERQGEVQIIEAAGMNSSNDGDIFIVHGHDEATLNSVSGYIHRSNYGLNLKEPIVLSRMPNEGRTIIEKIEHYAKNVGLVFILLTPDDKYGDGERARQNVIFELGYFLGRLDRLTGRVLLLYKGNLDIPSNISGICYINIDNGVEAAHIQITTELKALGYNV
jgi:predicted nucleotide-binding protein